MAKTLEAHLNAEGKKFALVVSRFNDFITDKLLSGALDALVRSGAKDSDIQIVKVPGAFEIPLVAKKMASQKKVNAIINYDNFDIAPDLVDIYTDMVKRLVDRFYLKVTRYTTSTFLRMKLGTALSQRHVAPHIYESHAEARQALQNK